MRDLETDVVSQDLTEAGVATTRRHRHTYESTVVATAEIEDALVRLYIGPEIRKGEGYFGITAGSAIKLTAEQAIHLSRRLRALAGSIPA